MNLFTANRRCSRPRQIRRVFARPLDLVGYQLGANGKPAISFRVTSNDDATAYYIQLNEDDLTEIIRARQQHREEFA